MNRTGVLACLCGAAALILGSVAHAQGTGTAPRTGTPTVVATSVVTENPANISVTAGMRVYNWHDTTYNFSTTPVVVVDRGALSRGAPDTQTVLPTKSAMGKAAPAAVAQLTSAPFMSALRAALNQGDFVVLTGNGDGLLQDSLVEEVLGVTGVQVNSGMPVSAIGIYMPATATTPIVFHFYYTKAPTLSRLVSDATSVYSQNVATWNSEIGVQSSGSSLTPTNGTTYGSGNQWYYDALYTIDDLGSGAYNAKLQIDDSFTRGFHDSSISRWVIHEHYETETDYSNNTEVQNTWTKFNNANFYPIQQLVQYSPATYNPSYQSNISVGVGLTPFSVNTGVTIGWSWTYSVSAVYEQQLPDGDTWVGWNHFYAQNSPAAEQNYIYQPGAVMTNTAGNLEVALTNRVGWEYYDVGWITGYSNTFNDSVLMPDF